MTETNDEALAFDEVSFDKAEFEDGSERACAACKGDLGTQHYRVGDHAVCEACAEQVRQARESGSLARGAGFGLGAALVSAAVWYGVRELTGYEIGLIAIAVGWAVGVSVRKGAGGRGGVAARVLAVVLAYSAIAWSYVPNIAQSLAAEDGGAVAQLSPMGWALTVGFAYALPFLQLSEGIGALIGLAIVGFALYEAWKLSAAQVVPLDGPYPTASKGYGSAYSDART